MSEGENETQKQVDGPDVLQQGEEANESMTDDWAAALEEQGAESGDTGSTDAIAPAEYENFDGLEKNDTASSQQADFNLDVILDVPVTISMEIGRTQINIRNLLQFNQGSVVELDRLAGEPMDVLVNGTLIAHGEVVVVNDRFGIRLTDVISPVERVKKLK